jgi:hypothetical protein
VFPVRKYELNLFILFGVNLVFKWLKYIVLTFVHGQQKDQKDKAVNYFVTSA